MPSTEKPCSPDGPAGGPPDDPVTDVSRRSFLLDSIFMISGAAVSFVLAVPLIRFLTFPLRKTASDSDWSDVGPVHEFANLAEPVARPITVRRRDAWQVTSSEAAIYVLPQNSGEFRILSPVCPHLGCSVRWIGPKNQFICPCHNGTFSATGDRISGPPRRSMDSLEAKVDGGILKVRYKYFRQLTSTREETV